MGEMTLRQWVRAHGVDYFAALREFTATRDETGRGWVSAPGEGGPWDRRWAQAYQAYKAAPIRVGDELFPDWTESADDSRSRSQDEWMVRMAQKLRTAGWTVIPPSDET